MWFLDGILTWLTGARNYFLIAYREVITWIAPFRYLGTPLYSIYICFYYLTYYFSYFKEWCNDVAIKVGQIMSIQVITSYFSTWINYATTAWQWVNYAWSNVTGIINTWWSSTQQTVLAWIDNTKYWLQTQIDSLSVWVSNLQASINELLAQIPSINEILAWFADWWARILSPLTSWWNERLLDVKSLIQSELKDWFPFYDDLVNLWSSIKEFFVDPLGWLEAKFTDWFLGAE